MENFADPHSHNFFAVPHPHIFFPFRPLRISNGMAYQLLTTIPVFPSYKVLGVIFCTCPHATYKVLVIANILDGVHSFDRSSFFSNLQNRGRPDFFQVLAMIC